MRHAQRSPVGIVVLCCLAATSALSAQAAPTGEEASPATRAARWRALREAKLERLEPYRPGFLERQILAFEKAERPSIFDVNLGGIYPRVQGIAKGSQMAVGARLWRPNLAGSPIDLHASSFFSFAEYEFYDVQLGVIPGAEAQLETATPLPLRSTRGDDVFELATIARPDRHTWGLYASARYQHYTQLPFFGLGGDSRVGDESSYLQRDALYELHGAVQLGRRLMLGASGGYARFGIGPGEDERYPSIEEIFDESAAPGLLEQPDYWTTGVLLQLDTRDVTANPGRGAVLALQAHRFDDPDDRYSFTRLAVDARAYVPLGSPQRVLALRAYGVRDEAAPGEQIPFFAQQTLGGSHTLRGFRNYRFRGERVALLQAEYRWEANPAVELALFVDSGMAANPGQSVDLDEFRTSWGAAIRFKAPETFLLRVEWAHSNEGNRFFARLSPAW